MMSAASGDRDGGTKKRPDRACRKVSHGSPERDLKGGSPTSISKIKMPMAQ